MYESYKDNDQVAFYFIYLREIHPSEQFQDADGNQIRRNSGPDISQHTSFEERINAASDCMKGLKMTIPTLIDSMDGKAQRAFQVHAAATAIIDKDGKLAFHSTGPRGVQPEQADKTIKRLLGIEDDDSESDGEEK